MAPIPWLSLLVFFPLVAAVLIAIMPAGAHKPIRLWATLAALAEFVFSIPLWWRIVPGQAGFQFEEKLDWIPAIGAQYHLGVDGVSGLLALLTTFTTLIAILGAWTSVEKRSREFFALVLALEAGMLGTFFCLDLLLFYVFWEAMLIPMYLLIGVWGGQRRVYAAVKFFLYTMAGSVLMLVAILSLWFMQKEMSGVPTFDLHAFYQLPISPDRQFWLFLAFAFAFAIKVPMFPLHTWLPDAHVEAPTAGSVILAAVLLKMGTYGFLRFAMPMFPNALLVCAPWIAWLAIIGIVYGALVAMVQPDLKKLVAYSSVSHMGFAMLGLMALNLQGFSGSTVQGMIGWDLELGSGAWRGTIGAYGGLIFGLPYRTEYPIDRKQIAWFGLGAEGQAGVEYYLNRFFVLNFTGTFGYHYMLAGADPVVIDMAGNTEQTRTHGFHFLGKLGLRFQLGI